MVSALHSASRRKAGSIYGRGHAVVSWRFIQPAAGRAGFIPAIVVWLFHAVMASYKTAESIKADCDTDTDPEISSAFAYDFAPEQSKSGSSLTAKHAEL